MSESLTLEQLESLDKMAGNPAFEDCLGSVKVDRHELCDLISMARRSLQLEERLRKALEEVEDAMMHLRTNIDIDGNKMDQSDAFSHLDKCWHILGGPKAVRPPVPATPPVEPDALP